VSGRSQEHRTAPGNLDAVRDSFDAMAEAYAQAFRDELNRKPFDRGRLDELVAATRPDGRVLDLGCGAAGHIGRYLADRGLAVTGVDFSEQAIEVARRLNSGMTFQVADIRGLPFVDDSIAAISSFYCLIYGKRPEGLGRRVAHGNVDANAAEVLEVLHALTTVDRGEQPASRFQDPTALAEGRQHFLSGAGERGPRSAMRVGASSRERSP